eukprot:1156330-Pelagomonas_calceolata.AAC.6
MPSFPWTTAATLQIVFAADPVNILCIWLFWQVAIMLKEDAGADVAIQDASGQLAKAYAPDAWADLIGP